MPVAIVDKNIEMAPERTRQATADAAEAFVNFLFTPTAQEEYAKCGLR
jgi:sulfate/thiosulfate transport system substrate-binding protein